MATVRRQADINVVEAARIRVKNVFDNGLPVYLSFSGGKDSLSLGHLVYDMARKGEVDPKQLTVIFIDEEAIFPCVERITKAWRMRFMEIGAAFRWYCLEVKHFNCFNQLENDESFICWDRNKKKVWVRQPPPFAIREHPELAPGRDSYQEFLPRITRDGIQITGVRVAESSQRLLYMSQTFASGLSISGKGIVFPVYDWRDTDVWLYLLQHDIDIPEAYLYLWQIGAGRNRLRLSQFFSVDTAGVLVSMGEYYPDLMEKVTAREPNAYLASLYWDSELFRRGGPAKGSPDEVKRDYQAMVTDILTNKNNVLDTPLKKKVANYYRSKVLKYHNFLKDKHWKAIYEGLIAGDPKYRALRGIMGGVIHDFSTDVQNQRRKGGA